MAQIYLHEHPEFEQLLRIVSDAEGIHPVLVEKDYWIMHVLCRLAANFTFFLKGGTSLSKGYGCIDRFSYPK